VSVVALSLVLGAVPLLLATIGAAVLIGGYKWVKALNALLGQLPAVMRQLSAVAEQLSGVASDVLDVRRDLTNHVREADARWMRMGGLAPHHRYLTDDNRIPEQVGHPAP
jgi:hypothetical protein